MVIALSDYLVLAGVMFCLSIAGIFLNRKNVIILLMAIELMLLSVNMNFIAFSYFSVELAGQSVRVLYSDGRGCRGRDRACDSGGAVPQPQTINVPDLDA